MGTPIIKQPKGLLSQGWHQWIKGAACQLNLVLELHTSIAGIHKNTASASHCARTLALDLRKHQEVWTNT